MILNISLGPSPAHTHSFTHIHVHTHALTHTCTHTHSNNHYTCIPHKHMEMAKE